MITKWSQRVHFPRGNKYPSHEVEGFERVWDWAERIRAVGFERSLTMIRSYGDCPQDLIGELPMPFSAFVTACFYGDRMTTNIHVHANGSWVTGYWMEITIWARGKNGARFCQIERQFDRRGQKLNSRMWVDGNAILETVPPDVHNVVRPLLGCKTS